MMFLDDTFDETGAISTVNELQRAIHRGRAFSISGKGSIAGANSQRFLFRVGAKDAHFMDALFDFAEGNIDLTIYEAPTVSANGTAKASVNLNRVPPIPAATVGAYLNPTVSANGTELEVVSIMPTTKAPASSALAAGRIFAANTDYLLVISNLNATGSTNFGYTLLWQEV